MKQLFFIVLVLSSCGKKVTKLDSDYIGHWKDVGDVCYNTINISENNDGEYNYGGTTKECHDRLKGTSRLTNNALMIGIRKFKIRETPTAINDTVFDTETFNMRMKLVIPHWLSNSGRIITFYKKK